MCAKVAQCTRVARRCGDGRRVLCEAFVFKDINSWKDICFLSIHLLSFNTFAPCQYICSLSMHLLPVNTYSRQGTLLCLDLLTSS